MLVQSIPDGVRVTLQDMTLEPFDVNRVLPKLYTDLSKNLSYSDRTAKGMSQI